MQLKAIPIFAAMSVLLCTTFILANHPTGDISVEAEGYGLTKNEALVQAKRQAVESGIGTVLIAQTEIENFQLQKDIVLTRTQGSVRSYKILHQEKKSNNAHFVRIQAIVSLASIKADLVALKVLLESMDKPRMLVVIQEKNGRSAENAIVEYLKAKQFSLVDPTTVAAVMKKDAELIRQAAAGDAAVAAAIGADNGAEYIIVGDVTKSIGSSELLKNAGLVSGQADITAKVINCSSGRIIASKSAHSAAAHISEETAMNAAAEKAGNNLMDSALFATIVDSFQDMVNNGMPLDVAIQPVTNYRQQKEIRKNIDALDKEPVHGGIRKQKR